MSENLFSYGTLQNEAVQLSTFNRRLEGMADAITGYKLSYVEIKDGEVVATSGLTHHPILTYSGNENDTISGTVFKISHEDLLHADEYETSDYKRVLVNLKSGGKAWVYIDANDGNKNG
jgi:gamma-glutamylcyclotransferase (GGCT)/AIG2-like uncharacterized protein YtfP